MIILNVSYFLSQDVEKNGTVDPTFIFTNKPLHCTDKTFKAKHIRQRFVDLKFSSLVYMFKR